MHLFFKIEIADDILVNQKFKVEEKKYISSFFKNEEISYSDINLDNLTISDLCDYFEFTEPQKVTFITNQFSQRFLNIIEYIKKELFFDFEYDILNIEENNRLEFLGNIYFEDSINVESRLNNSYFAVHSGMYPYEENIHIKHILLDKTSSFENLDISILTNMSLNSLFIIEENDKSIKSSQQKNVFSKIISYEDFIKKCTNKKFNFELYSDSKLREEIEIFLNTGELTYNNNFPFDYGKKYPHTKIFSLFIQGKDIYYDFLKTIKIAEGANKSIYEIINELSSIELNKNLNFEINILNEFVNVKLLSNIFKNDLIFITNSNKYKIESNINSVKFKEWIGIIKGDKKYLLNKIQNRLFEVDENFICIFEYLVKNQENLLDGKYSELLPKAKELLSV